jgi:hypothetical protein
METVDPLLRQSYRPERMITVSDSHSEAVVLRDGDGNYYAVPRIVVERYLVPSEHARALEAAAGDDLAGVAPTGRVTFAGIVALSVLVPRPEPTDREARPMQASDPQ